MLDRDGEPGSRDGPLSRIERKVVMRCSVVRLAYACLPGFFQGARTCTCKGGCGVDTTTCSFAFETCGGQRYETCGPNATAELNEKWECVPDA